MLFTINEILDIAIRLEKNGEAVYRNAIDKISNPSLVSLLEWMAAEESRHAKWFNDLKQKGETDVKNSIEAEISVDFLNNLIGDQSFSLKEIDFSQVDQIKDLVSIFIEFENDSILFYKMLQPLIQDQDTLVKLHSIVDEENRHIAKLREFIENEKQLSENND